VEEEKSVAVAPLIKNRAAETTPRVLLDTVGRFGDKVALRKKEFGLWHDILWADYYRQVRYVGQALITLGLRKGDCVSIIGDNCHQWVMADLGIQCAGGVSVGIYATNAWQQVEYVVDHSDSGILFVENEEQLDKWLKFKDRAVTLRKVIVWDTEGLRRFSDPALLTFDQLVEIGQAADGRNPQTLDDRMQAVKPEDLCVLIYTSGTTGQPKGAMLTHRNVTWMARAVSGANAIYAEDEVLSFLPLCHIFERLFSVFIHITYAYTVNFVEKPDTIMDNMIEISPTVGYAVPRIWEKYYSAIMINLPGHWFKVHHQPGPLLPDLQSSLENQAFNPGRGRHFDHNCRVILLPYPGHRVAHRG